MPHTAFSPATLDLLPGESPCPPLRLLERAPGRSRPVLPASGRVAAQPWLARLWQVAARHAGL